MAMGRVWIREGVPVPETDKGTGPETCPIPVGNLIGDPHRVPDLP